ncbi:MAG: tetratricopeptide repeat protein [Bacteroidota bacterium]|nr:tetratricopeptide repeat protein [Bacteroidota bacterium]
MNPESKDFMLFSYRGNAKTKLRDFNGAIEDFDRALDIEPTEVADYSNWVRNYYNRGVAKFYVNDLNGACRDWHNAYELGFGVALEYLNKYCQ